MKRFAFSTFIVLAMCLFAGPVRAQDSGAGAGVDGDGADAADAPEPRLFSFDTAGFVFEATVPHEPVVRETSNGEYYTVSFQRRIAGGFAEGSDGQMAFMRLTRTVEPLGDEKLVREVLEDTIRGAVSSMDDTFGLRRDRKFTETTLRILGAEREGRRVDIAVLGDGTRLYAECYAFEDRHGHGVGVMMKLSEPGDDAMPEDLMLSDEILGSLEVKDLPAEGWYTYELGQTTLRLPVRSKQDRVRRVNPYVVEASFALERGTLRVQVIRPPEDVDLGALSQQQLSGYAGALRQQQQRGELNLEWASDSYLPVRGERDVLLRGVSFGLHAGGVGYYNSMYAPVVDDGVLVASFSGAEVYTADLVGYASGFFAGADLGIERPVRRVYAAGYELAMPGGLRVFSSPGVDADAGYLFAPSGRDNWATVVGAPGEGRGGYTRVVFVGADDALTLGAWHAGLIEEESRRLGATAGAGEPVAVTQTLADGRVVDGLLTVVEAPVEGEADGEEGDAGSGGLARVALSSYAYPAGADGVGAMVTTVSSAPKHAELNLVTGLVLERIARMSRAERIEMPFGSIALAGGSIWAEVTEDDADGGVDRRARVVMGTDELVVTTRLIEADEAEDSSGTAEEKASRYLGEAWRSVAPEGMGDLFPGGTDGLGAVSVGGVDALMFEAEAEMDGESVYQRAVGFMHEGVYTTAVVVQPSGSDPARAGRLLGLLRVSE